MKPQTRVVVIGGGPRLSDHLSSWQWRDTAREYRKYDGRLPLLPRFPSQHFGEHDKAVDRTQQMGLRSMSS